VNVNAGTTATITAGGATTFCAGGSVTLTANSGANYLWSNGAQTQAITVTAGGSYYVTVSNASGCSATSTATAVTVNPLPTATIVANGPTTFCQGGSVTLTAGAGASYLWSNNATTQSITVSATGTYTVTLTNASGCTATSLPIAVTTFATPVATITAVGSTTFCQGGNVILAANAGQGYSYQWNNNTNDQSLTVTSSGSYTVTVTDANGCSAVSSPTVVTVNANPVATITASGATTFCQGGTVTLTAGTGTSYLWSNNATTQSITASTTGTFTVTVANANGCTSVSAPLTVTVNQLPLATVTANGPTTFCQGGSVTLVSTPGSSYLWSGNNAITQSNTVSTSGTYTVTVTNSDGCSATSPGVLVTVNSATVPTITASGSTTICQGTNVLLTASAGTAYAWSTGETSQSILASTAGPHTVTVTNANGCTATSAATTIIVNNLPSVAAITGVNNICEGSTTTLASATVGGVWSSSNTGVASVSTSGVVTGVANGNTVLTYTLTDVNGCTNSANASMTVNGLPVAAISANGATTFCAGGSVTLTSSTGTSYVWVGGDISPSITVTTSGSYYVQVTNAAGCTSTSAPITVVVNPLPTVAPITGSGNVCFGLTTQMSNLTTGGIWSSADNAIASIDATTGVVTGNAVGATVLTYTVTNANGCSTSATWLMTVNASPSVTIAANGPTTFCQGSSVTLTATPGATYLWNNNEITQSIDVTNAGLYFVTITNAAGCTAVSNSINVNVNGLSSAVITASGPLTFCQGDNVTLTATPGTNYLWSTGETTQSIVVTSTMAVHVDVTNATGCVTSSAITYVTVIPSVQAVITANGPTTLCLGSSVTLSGPTANGVSYTWDNGVTTASTQSITVNTAGVYSLTVSTGNGCSSTATQTVLVNPNPNVTITANGPTLFCQGGSVTLTASGATSYVWSDGSITPSITTSIPGNYFVVGTNNNGCESTSATTTVTVSTIPTVSAITGANNVCESSSVQLTSATANGIWTSSNNFIATVSSTGLVTGLNAGTTTITYTVTNGACSSSVSSVMNVLNLPVVPTITPSGATTMCPGGTVILFASNAANYQWSSGPQTPLITVNQSGDYTVTVTNASGCSATSLPITVFIGDNTNPVIVPPANVTMAPNFACEAIGVNLGAPVTSDNCSVATVSNDAPAIFPLGLTTVTWTVVDGSGNTSTATQLVNIVDNILPTINVNDLTVVINDNGSTTITFSDVDNGTTDNCGIASMTLSQYTFDCSNIGDNTVTVTVTDNNGNVATTSVLITVVTSGTDTDNDGLLNACDTDDDGDGIVDTNEEVGDTDGDGIPNTLDPDDDGDGISTVIEGTDDQDGDGISNYLDSDSDGDGLSDDFEWDFGGLAEPGQDCDQDGLYDFLDTDKCGPVVPDAFTPNGNNYNDLFVVPGIEAYETRQLFVYSRYGTLVYESNLYNNDWDGTLLNSGSPVPDGTYYYVFKLDNGLIVNGYVYINRVKK
jgi:gliding motility-associated-like protein